MFKTKNHVAHRIPMCQNLDSEENNTIDEVATSKRRNHLVRECISRK